MKLNIKRFNPCIEGFRFYEMFSTFEAFWASCPRGDWMLWLAGRLDIDHRTVVRAAALCANTVRHLMEERSMATVDAALRYADGEISLEEAQEYRGGIPEYKDYFSYPKYSAASAAYAIFNSVSTFYRAAIYATDADVCFNHESPDAARSANQLETANICREVLTEAVYERVKQLNLIDEKSPSAN